MSRETSELLRSDIVCCTSTVASRDEADSIAGQLLAESLAACVQIDGPIRSHFRWKGETHCSEEFRLTIKTSGDAWPRLKVRLAEIHSYDEPQIICTEIVDATDDYRDWVIGQTKVSS